jgi:hypothetical protein
MADDHRVISNQELSSNFEVAAALVATTRSNKASRLETSLNRTGAPFVCLFTSELPLTAFLGDVVANAFGGNANASAFTQSSVAQEAFSLVKTNVSNFVQYSQLVMTIVDEVAKVHWCIAGVLSLAMTV